ncbi:hypothetical protein ACJX0J_035172, partial [Zea mays]
FHLQAFDYLFDVYLGAKLDILILFRWFAWKQAIIMSFLHLFSFMGEDLPLELKITHNYYSIFFPLLLGVIHVNLEKVPYRNAIPKRKKKICILCCMKILISQLHVLDLLILLGIMFMKNEHYSPNTHFITSLEMLWYIH